MASNEKIKLARKKAEEQIYEIMNDFDPTGYNTETYRLRFEKMPDIEFINMMKEVSEKEDINFPFTVDTYGKKGAPNLRVVEGIAKKHNISLTEHVMFPHRNPGGEPMVTKDKVPIMYLNVKRLQQTLETKNHISGNDEKRNPITGQVVDHDKSASLSDTQTYVLTVTNQQNSIKEFLGPRGDDVVSANEMMNLIQRDGEVSLNDLTLKTENKQAIQTAETFLRGSGLDIEFHKRQD